MATLATYRFKSDNEAGWRAAKDRISREIGGGYDTSAPMFDSFIYITITDKCANPGKAGEICRANGGTAG